MANNAKRIPNTDRQTVTTSDGKQLERRYQYHTRETWMLLAELARNHNTSISKLIDLFAERGEEFMEGLNLHGNTR